MNNKGYNKSRDMLMNTVSSNTRLPPDARETVRNVLYYLRKRQELSKKPSPKGFKVIFSLVYVNPKQSDFKNLLIYAFMQHMKILNRPTPMPFFIILNYLAAAAKYIIWLKIWTD